MDLISVIVPIYKVEKYLDRCVESIVNQTYKDLEIWLVDDGSPDNCPKMCDEWAKKDIRIKVIHKENGGLSDARNAALEVMTGDYVTFVDSDDYIELDSIETMYNALVRNDAQIAMGNMVGIYENGEIHYMFQPFEKETILMNSDKLKLINCPWGPDKLYKSDVFSFLRYPVGKHYEDLYIWHIILKNVNKIVMTGKDAYYYCIRQESIMQSAYSIKNADRFEAQKAKADWLDSIGRNDLATESRLFIYSDFADACANMNFYSGENKKRFNEIKMIFNDAFVKMRYNRNINFKQKIRLYMLRYFPLLHTEFFR